MSIGASVDDFNAPLFIAWQLTNRCSGRCRACCEDSGPDKAWPDELNRDEALSVARQIAGAGVPYVAFGGGEPLAVPHVWSVLQTLSDGGVSLKIETDGGRIDAAVADRLAELNVDNVQISLDGTRPATHARLRPGAASFEQGIAALERLIARGVPAEWVFVPTRSNLDEAVAAFDHAAALGCSAFITGPLMRLGRAAERWPELAPDPADWAATAAALRQRADARPVATRLSIYPWDIQTEIEQRLVNPQAMLLIVPDGQVKLLNALPFAPANLRRHDLMTAWARYREAWRSERVAAFVARCAADASLLRHANETWPLKAPGVAE